MSKILQSKVYEIDDDSSDEDQGPQEMAQSSQESDDGFQMVEDSENGQPL